MAGSREDGTFAEDKAHHPARKVPNPRLVANAGGPFERTYKYGLGVTTTGEDGVESYKHVAFSDNPSAGAMYKHMTRVQRPEGMGTYVYTEDN